MKLAATIIGLESATRHDGVPHCKVRINDAATMYREIAVPNIGAFELDEELEITIERIDPFEKYRGVPFMEQRPVVTDEPPSFWREDNV